MSYYTPEVLIKKLESASKSDFDGRLLREAAKVIRLLSGMQEGVVNRTPDAAVLQQLEGQWQKMAAMILWKTNKLEPVVITIADMQEIRNQPEPLIVLTHGHVDSLEFRLVTEAQAKVLQEHAETMRGSA